MSRPTRTKLDCRRYEARCDNCGLTEVIVMHEGIDEEGALKSQHEWRTWDSPAYFRGEETACSFACADVLMTKGAEEAPP